MNKIILAIISGLGVALSFNFPNFSFLIWFSLTPLFFILSKKRSLKHSFSFLIFGFIYYGVSLYWVAYVSVLGYFLLISYLSLLYLVFYFLGSFFIKRPLRCLTIPFLWVMIEFLKESIWCGFGWANLGYSQFNNLYLIQIADLGGTKLISFVIVLVNFLIWRILIINKNEKDKNIFKLILNKLGLILIIFITILTYSFYKLNKIEAKEKIEISVVQTNILDKHLL
ncbi:MAG: hypothetical protein K9L61_04780, partial [Candidatus Omnitrophica bacterium]|nr:hypothetical protein [Candidatus Omnitrophota bacterium]